jgi:hypothetical protein
MGKGGNDRMWCVSVWMCPFGIVIVLCGALIQPYQGMTTSIQQFLFGAGLVMVLISICVNITLRYFYMKDVEEVLRRNLLTNREIVSVVCRIGRSEKM